MLRRTFWMALLSACLFNAGGCCCCCGPFAKIADSLRPHCVADDYRGGGSYYADCGCGELYIDDWHSNPPRCEPCDQCTACWTGPGVPPPMCSLPPRAGSIMPSGGVPEGAIIDGPMSDDMSSAQRTKARNPANSSTQR
jgi:hypothetical protein